MKKVVRTKVLKPNAIVKMIGDEAGINVENATKIFNVISNLWTVNRIGLLSCLEAGIPVTTKRRIAKKVTKKAVAKVAKTVKKVKKKTVVVKDKVKGTKVLGKVKTKKNKKGKKKLKKGLNIPVEAKKSKMKTA